MRSSRLDIVPLLDIILLLFFALALSMQKEHKKEKKQLVQQIDKKNKKIARIQQIVTQEEKQIHSLERKLKHLNANYKQLRQVFSHLQRLLGLLASDSAGTGTGIVSQKQFSSVKRRLEDLHRLVQQLRSQKQLLLLTQKKLKKTLRHLLVRVQQLSQRIQKMQLQRKRTKEEMLSLRARLRLLEQAKKQLRAAQHVLQTKLTNTKASLVLAQAENSRFKKKLKELLASEHKKELAYRILMKRLKEAIKKQYAKQTKQLGQTILEQQKRWQKLKLKTLMLQAKLELAKRDAKQQKKQLQRWKKAVSVLQSMKFRYEAKLQLLSQQNKRLALALNAVQLKLQKNQIYRQEERKSFRRVLAAAERREQRLSEKNKRLKASQMQLSSALRQLKVLGRLPGKEKSGLVKSMTRYLLAVFIYVKSDRITGFRRFKDRRVTTFDRPIDLSRRTRKSQKLRYRSAVEPAFSAFARLEARLPAEIVSSLEAIYIFVFDENTTKAVTSGLEFEHQTKYKARRVIWQL